VTTTAEPGAGFVLVIYKEVSWTSHDAVARVRRILGQRQVGHGGSLDPLASGVLMMAVGRATKLLPHLVDLPKEYTGTIRFGWRTASGDLGGERVAEAPVPPMARGQVQDAASTFLGRTLQVPPMVSAVKHEGRRLYELARRGVEVERSPRPIDIASFDIRGYDPPRADFEVVCGKGTYIRTLAEDLASRLGTIGVIESLVRSRVGRFEVADACRLISRPCSEREGLLARAIPMSEALGHLPLVRVERKWTHRIRHGAAPPWQALEFDFDPSADQSVRIVGPEGDLLAIGSLSLVPGPAERTLRESLGLRLERVV